jgi:hypothetical protein
MSVLSVNEAFKALVHSPFVSSAYSPRLHPYRFSETMKKPTMFPLVVTMTTKSRFQVVKTKMYALVTPSLSVSDQTIDASPAMTLAKIHRSSDLSVSPWTKLGHLGPPMSLVLSNEDHFASVRTRSPSPTSFAVQCPFPSCQFRAKKRNSRLLKHFKRHLVSFSAPDDPMVGLVTLPVIDSLRTSLIVRLLLFCFKFFSI